MRGVCAPYDIHLAHHVTRTLFFAQKVRRFLAYVKHLEEKDVVSQSIFRTVLVCNVHGFVAGARTTFASTSTFITQQPRPQSYGEMYSPCFKVV